MLVSALALEAEFANVEKNLQKCREYVKKASQEGSELILLPEFFTTSMGFSPKMDDAAVKGRSVRKWMQKLAADFKIIIGGAYLLYDGEQAYDIFDLVFPSGAVFSHKKDIPTQIENCYCTFGDTENVLHTPIGDIGVALCWEMLRTDTLNRLAGRCDFILACSCWWDLDEENEDAELRLYNRALAAESPVVLARLLGTPVLHASHCGTVTADSFPGGETQQTRPFVGAAQLIDGNGTLVNRHSFVLGEGLITDELELRHGRLLEYDRSHYWIPDLPEPYLRAWKELGAAGQRYYREKMLPRYMFSV